MFDPTLPVPSDRKKKIQKYQGLGTQNRTAPTVNHVTPVRYLHYLCTYVSTKTITVRLGI